MKYEPHDYQKYAIKYIEEHPVSAVFLGMSLGKTSITLTAIKNLLFDRFDVHKVLVVAPLRVARSVWTDEIAKWEHLHCLISSVAVGNEKERLEALKQKADIYIISRDNVEWLIEKSKLPFDYDMLVLDELSSFKNHRAKRFRALMKVRPKIKRVVGLTGTPAGNGLMDLWAEFRLLDMGERLGKFISAFRETYFMPDKRNGAVVYSYKPLSFAEEEIYKKISDITVSMKTMDYLPMPRLIINDYKVQMSDKEKKQYKTLAKEMVLDDEITASNAASLSVKLSQMSNGAIYADNGEIKEIHSRKLDALEDIIESANGKSVLVAYWFKHDLIRISERLKKLHIPFSRLDTSDSIRSWNKGEIPVALIHPASAGHGLNLQAGGNVIVWFGLTWSLELYQQTNARLWRQGQKNETVVIYHIITENTIDEKILKALKSKDKTQDTLIEAVKAEVKFL